MKWKQGLLAALSAAAVAAAIPMHVAAEEPVKYKTEEASVVVLPEAEELPENAELFEGYVNELFYGSYGISAYGNFGGERLEREIDKKAYRLIKEKIEKIAAGEEPGSEIVLSAAELGIKDSWLASEIGVNSIIEVVDGKYKISGDAEKALWKEILPDISRILRHLLADCPYEFYWYDKTAGTRTSASGMRAETQQGEWVLKTDNIKFYYRFTVAEAYRVAPENGTVVNISLAQTAKNAAANAKAIVDQYERSSDYRKLDAYRQEICSLVQYNHSAADNEDTPYGDPWQLIWVFDGNPETDVVCEGYAKAFQYLCDMSSFVNDTISCYTVTGLMGGGTGAGGHMWNIVTMNDNKNYMVDITNCDAGTVGAGGRLFMAGAKASVRPYSDGKGGQINKNVYIVTIDGQEIVYCYDEEMEAMYGGILDISGEDYEVEDIDSGNFGKDTPIAWKLDGRGCLTITGSGNMEEPEGSTMEELMKSIPWLKHQSDISMLKVGEGITGISSFVFAFMEKLKDVSLPDTLQRIDHYSFAQSGIETIELPESLNFIGLLAFSDCRSLTELEIPASVKYICSEAFKNCTSLTDVTFLGDCPEFLVPQDGQDMGTIFDGDALRVHYLQEYAAAWEEAMTGTFSEDQITWIDSCGEGRHVWETAYTVDLQPGCGTAGSQSYHCRNCKEIDQSRIASLPPTGKHSYGGWNTIKQPSCTESGLQERACGICGDKDMQTVPENGHAWNAAYTIDRNATSMSAGQRSIHCKNCDEIKDIQIIPMTDIPGPGAAEPEQVSVTRILLFAPSKKIAAGKKVALESEVFPENAGNPSLIWSVDNAGYASVNAGGIVTTKKAGAGKTVTVTAEAADGSGVKASVKIKLMKHPVTKVKLKNPPKKIKAGKSVKLKAVVTAGKNSNKALKWTSSNEKFAKVDSKGRVTALKAGKRKTVTITAVSTDGTNKKVKVKIKIN